MPPRLLAHNGAGAVVGDKLIYHLSLDLSFTHICADNKKRSVFLKGLASPPTDAESIKARQEVLRDFIRSPELIERMAELAETLGTIREKWNDYRREKYHSMHDVSLRDTSAIPLTQCKAVAMSLRSALIFIRDLGELLDNYPIESPLLSSMRDEAKEMSSSPSFISLTALCGELEYRPARDPLDVRVTLNAQGQIGAVELMDHKHIRITDPDLAPRRSLFKKQPPQETYPCERLYPASNTVYEKLYTTPYFEVTNVLDHIIKQIFDRYSNLSSDLAFYGAARLYCEYMSDHGVSLIFPDFHDGGGVEVEKLYDLQFIVTKNTLSDIVPHSISCTSESEKGIVIFGDNGSGKTSFLRSFTTMQLLAQSGLPVPAEKASLRAYSGIISQFAESERDFEPGNDAGRFEQEVREMASLIDCIPRNSLVILNETFQTTSYEEGAAGLAAILRYLSREGVTCLLASHMRQLKSIFENDEVIYMTVSRQHELSLE